MKEDILGIKINSESEQEIIQKISEYINSGQKTRIFTPNPEMIVEAQKDNDFKSILNRAEITIPDGKGLIWASKILHKRLRTTITGTDLMIKLCEEASHKNWIVFLLGGRRGLVDKTKSVLELKYPKIKIIGCLEASPLSGDDLKTREEVLNIIGKEKIDLLFVAYGAPKQEKWIHRNINHLPVNVAMGVGGAFNYISGSVKRAPKWIRKVGLEWFYRLIAEPWRWKRQLKLIRFSYLVFLNRIQG